MQNNVTAHPIVIFLSKFISNFFNPLTSLFLYFAYYSSKHYDLKKSLYEFLPILLILILPISAWIYWNVRKGNYTNMDVSNRKQRNSLYIFIAVAMLVYLLINFMIDRQIDYTMLFLFILLILMQVSNYFIKSSMHTAINIFAAALFFAQNQILGLAWLFFAVMVGITRIILKRHTLKEVLMGAAIASIVSFFYLYIYIQNQ